MKRIITVALFITLCLAVSVQAWERNEHRLLGDSAFYGVMRQVGTFQNDVIYVDNGTEQKLMLNTKILNGKSFGQLCSEYAKDDLSRNRFHEWGKTILEQLQGLTADQIEAARLKTDENSVFPPKLKADNVISAYLLYHLTALHMVQRGAEFEDKIVQLNKALIVEAVAQGYLADAFSAGHILTPVSDLFAFMHPRNKKESHNYHRNNGVYVINSRGDIWQTFGDKIMHWYTPTYQAVLEACQSSLKELLIVFFHTNKFNIPESLRNRPDNEDAFTSLNTETANWLSIQNGDMYYSGFRMPTLMLLPMPVSASWSYRTQSKDNRGIRRHHHFPQLKENGLHDPDPGEIDRNFLYSRPAVPDWMVPEPLVNGSPDVADSLIKRAPDWASVRWVQKRYAPPSFKGLLLHTGGQVMFKGDRSEIGGMIALGYGLWDDLILLRNISLNLAIMPSVYEPGRLLLATSAGGGLNFQLFGLLRALHFETGYAFGLNSKYKQNGPIWAAGFDSNVIPLRFTNAGITIRIQYRTFYLEDRLHGPSIEFILH